jgi:hypothetical protein
MMCRKDQDGIAIKKAQTGRLSSEAENISWKSVKSPETK